MTRAESGHAVDQRQATLFASSLGAAIVLLNVTIVNVATPYIGASLGSGVSGLQWIVNAYTLAFASLLLPAGALGDRLGSRFIFALGLTVFALGSLGCALAPSLSILVAARALQGAGAALILPTSLSLIANACVGDEPGRARAIGMWSAIGGVVSAAGPAVGGMLIAAFGWKSIFIANIPLCLVALWSLLARVREAPLAPPTAFDTLGQVLAILFFFVLTATFIEAGTHGWADLRIAAGLVLSAIVLAGFLVAEKLAVAPILPLQLLRPPTVSLPLILGLVTNLAFYGLIFVLSVYFQKVRAYSPAQTGLAFLPFVIIMVGNLASAPLSARFGYRAPVAGGLALSAGGYFMLGALLDKQQAYAMLLPGLLLMSFGGGLALPALTATLLGGVEQTRTGTVSGIFNTGRQVGAALGVALFGALLAGDTPSGLVAGATLAFFASGYLLLISILPAALLLPGPSAATRAVEPVRH